ncbi:MAG: hypothetical protein GWM88_02805, partial [Pseudomonadales bacterium]|nr:6,7-dimethyl-8-ribityllumazine synthase [Pseudomonadales bacterium]NIX07002.1 hypothetical protein [Pseudomonadales bacterium]
QTAIDISQLPVIENAGRVAILKSKWYPELVDSMARCCEEVLRGRGIDRVEVHTLPGSLELPLAAADLLAADGGDDIDAIVCFGIILKGETLHFEMITNE